MRLTTLFLALTLTTAAHAIEIKIAPEALERTLNRQLFNDPENRYFIKGKSTDKCFVYAQSPKVTLKDDRIWIHIKAKARLGTSMMGACVGVGLTTEADVSVIPEAEGESIGFRDARIERLSDSRELNFLLVPFLSRKLPQQMKVNAADLVRQLLSTSAQTTGYDLKLDNLKLHSMQVNNNNLVVDFDGDLSVH